MQEREYTGNDVVIQDAYIKADEVAELGDRKVTVAKCLAVNFAREGQADDWKDVLEFTDGTRLSMNATRKAAVKAIVKPADGKVTAELCSGLELKLTTCKVRDPKTGKQVNSIAIENGAAF